MWSWTRPPRVTWPPRHGGLFAIQPDQALPSLGLLDVVSALPAGTPYVLSVLTPPREEHLDPSQLAALLATLSGNHAPTLTGAAFQVVAGITGETPALIHSADRPFRADVRLLDDPFTIRMESWLPTDTFRRAGFGHVLRGRQRVQILERGVNLVWFDRSANPLSLYTASLLQSHAALSHLVGCAGICLVPVGTAESEDFFWSPA